jgi:hypothetical protein
LMITDGKANRYSGLADTTFLVYYADGFHFFPLPLFFDCH